MKNNFYKLPVLLKVVCMLGLLNQTSLKAADLPRKTMLGIRMEALTDPIKEQQQFDQPHGIFIPDVMPEGSFATMGVQDSVILQRINGQTITSTSEVLNIISNIYENESIEVVVFKDGKSDTLRGQTIGKPREDHPWAEVIYGSVSYPGNQLRSLLYLPKDIENPPVVFFIQGYTCQTVEMPNWNPIKKLIGDWLKAGFAVYMVEKPGMGDSQSDMPCMQIDFNGELKAFSQAYSTLQQNKQIDSKNIFLFGHSMGGVIAPLLSQVNKPKGIMVYGIMGKNWYDYMLDIFTEQRKLLGATDEEISEALKYDQPFIYDMLIRKKTNHELISTANYAGHLEQKGIAKDLKEGYYLQRHYTFWQTLADVDISKAWAKVEAPVYVLHGEYDIQAIAPEHGKLIVTHVIAHGGNARFEVIPKTEHAFLHFDSMEQNIQVRSDGTYRNALASRYNPEVAKLSIEWMKQLLEE